MSITCHPTSSSACLYSTLSQYICKRSRVHVVILRQSHCLWLSFLSLLLISLNCSIISLPSLKVLNIFSLPTTSSTLGRIRSRKTDTLVSFSVFWKITCQVLIINLLNLPFPAEIFCKRCWGHWNPLLLL